MATNKCTKCDQEKPIVATDYLYAYCEECWQERNAMLEKWNTHKGPVQRLLWEESE